MLQLFITNHCFRLNCKEQAAPLHKIIPAIPSYLHFLLETNFGCGFAALCPLEYVLRFFSLSVMSFDPVGSQFNSSLEVAEQTCNRPF
jgi:hypothetical protein